MVTIATVAGSKTVIAIVMQFRTLGKAPLVSEPPPLPLPPLPLLPLPVELVGLLPDVDEEEAFWVVVPLTVPLQMQYSLI